jgi:predicted HD superfamily hydrolase involved in NAD metabolism
MKTEHEDILEYLKQNVSSARYKHTLGTWKTAREIAKAHGCLDKRVDVAALLHDAGKSMKLRKILSYVRRNKIKMPFFEETLKYNPWILHGFVSADIAKKVFGIKDNTVLDAMRTHTIGSPDMTTLGKIIYLADITAPDRKYKLVKKIRWHAKRNLGKAMMLAMENKICHVLSKRKWLHPVAVMAWNSLAKTTK